MNNQEKLQLLWSRAGFGMPLAALGWHKSVERTIAGLLEVPPPVPIEVLTAEDWEVFREERPAKDVPDKAAMKLRQQSLRQETGNLGLLWLSQMASTEHPLQEKMALFWHGHFATRINQPYYDQQLLQVLRANGLGSFKDLLFGVSKSAAMIAFLNNKQNRKQHPNENFARELMELFTLGRGNYTEQDVKEAARAFTGWTTDEDGAFIIRQNQHDGGQKTFLGKTGNFGGEDILNIVLQRRETALFITRKIYNYFVNEEQVDDAWLKELATGFYDSGYDIAGLMRAVFSDDRFYSTVNRGARIKSPVELLTGMQRTVPATFEDDRTLINLQRVLGQQLFYPPNVGGWPRGRAWIDSSALVTRMRLPEAIYGGRELELRAKEIDAEMTEINKQPMMPDSGKGGKFQVGRGEADWTAFVSHWQKEDEAKLPRLLADYLLAVPLGEEQLKTASRYASGGSKETFIRTLSIRLMSLPEYQLA